MIIELHNTTSSAIAKKLVQVREEGGAVALGRVLTLVVLTEDRDNEAAIRAANEASSEHPMRVIVVHSTPGGDTFLDAEIRVGRDAGAGEVVVLHANGDTTLDLETLVQGLLLPDAPVVAWWPDYHGGAPKDTAIGRIAQVRVLDTHDLPDGAAALSELAAGWAPGDSNLAWTRLTHWRAQLAAVLDQPPYEPVERATVTGLRGSSGVILLAAWLRHYLDAPVELEWSESDRLGHSRNIHSVRLERASGAIELERVSPVTARLHQPDQPEQLIPLMSRANTEVLAEELRSLAPDEVYATVLREGVPIVCAESLDAHPVPETGATP